MIINKKWLLVYKGYVIKSKNNDFNGNLMAKCLKIPTEFNYKLMAAVV